MKSTDTLPNAEVSWIDLMLKTYEAGGSDIEVCKALKVTLPKFNAKYQSDSKFQELVDYGRLTSNSWWMEQARRAIFDRSFNTPMWIFVMKNRFGWADKTEAIQHLPDAMTDLDSLKSKLETLLPGIIKQLNPNMADSQILKDLRSVK